VLIDQEHRVVGIKRIKTDNNGLLRIRSHFCSQINEIPR
jgi:hypothetical protein